MSSGLSALQEELARKWSNSDWTEADLLDGCESSSEEGLLAVGGCARSGTTLVRVVLDSHHSIVVGPPTNVFIPVPLVPDDIAFRLDLDVKWVRGAIEQSEDRVRFIELLAGKCKETYGKRVWGEKTARNVHRFSWILRHFPNARVIHVIRDGRDVVSSLRTHRRRQVIEGYIRPLVNEMPLELCIERWARSVRDGLMNRGDARYCEVRYEDLVANPIQTISDLCSFLGLDFDLRMLTFHEMGGPLRDPLRFPQNVEATSPLSSSSVGRWRKDLSTREQQLVEDKLKDLLVTLGYLQNEAEKQD